MARLLDYPILLALLTVLVVTLAAGLRPDAFYSGDSGIKLLATRAALQHPSHPLDIPLPVIGEAPTQHVEPFLVVHDQHAHAITSPIFPIMSAPFLAVFGLRGLYVIPALSFLLAIVACVALARALRLEASPSTTTLVSALATPFLFYGLEFWEHLPAVACATSSVALLLRGRAFAAGALLGVATLLRPEAAAFAIAVVAAMPWLTPRPSLRTLAVAALGVALAIAPYEIFLLGHFGTFVPPHLSTNAGAIQGPWLASRWSIAQSWFGAIGPTSFWTVAPCVIGAAVSLAMPGGRNRSFLWAVAIVDVGLTTLTAPNDGGSQWGVRYLLFSFVPFVLLTAAAIDQLPRHAAISAVLIVVTVGCGWVGRSSYRQLRSIKNIYGRIVDFVDAKAGDADFIVTDLWWLDQVAASTLADRSLLYTASNSTGADIVRILSDRAVPVVSVIRSSTESPDTASWSAGTCYVEERRDSISVRNLVAIRLRHRCPGP